MRGRLSSAIVVLSTGRSDTARTLYVRHEWEKKAFDVDSIAEALADARQRFAPALTISYYGGRDEDEVFRVLSIRLGHHIKTAPNDPTAPTQMLVNDFRTGRLKARPDSLVARDAKLAIWRDGVPDQTGILAALRCAHWAAAQYRPKPRPALSVDQQLDRRRAEKQRRMGRPF